jgi:hypothetical protein
MSTTASIVKDAAGREIVLAAFTLADPLSASHSLLDSLVKKG